MAINYDLTKKDGLKSLLAAVEENHPSGTMRAIVAVDRFLGLSERKHEKALVTLAKDLNEARGDVDQLIAPAKLSWITRIAAAVFNGPVVEADAIKRYEKTGMNGDTYNPDADRKSFESSNVWQAVQQLRAATSPEKASQVAFDSPSVAASGPRSVAAAPARSAPVLEMPIYTPRVRPATRQGPERMAGIPQASPKEQISWTATTDALQTRITRDGPQLVELRQALLKAGGKIGLTEQNVKIEIAKQGEFYIKIAAPRREQKALHIAIQEMLAQASSPAAQTPMARKGARPSTRT